LRRAVGIGAVLQRRIGCQVIPSIHFVRPLPGAGVRWVDLPVLTSRTLIQLPAPQYAILRPSGENVSTPPGPSGIWYERTCVPDRVTVRISPVAR
jgi:hypothetical protein